MPQSIRLGAVGSALLVLLTMACSSSKESQNISSVPSPSPATSPTISAVATVSQPDRVQEAASTPTTTTSQSDRFSEALDSAISAATIAQSAQSPDDWNLVSSRWQTAIELLKTVSKSSPNYTTAQKKITEYQRNMAYAQQQKKIASQPTAQKKVTEYQRNIAYAQEQKQNASQPPGVATVPPTTAPESAKPQATQSPMVTPELALAIHLKQIGAIFYGVYWCPYCKKQKEIFGQEAFSQIKSVECDPQGQNPQPELCQNASISSYPTWQIKGQLYPGMRSLEELAELSSYQGDAKFNN
ncbi:MAG TPA: hypothetical protein DDZ80_17110 [Cyanobacteria bacterium UBA8803]|nr:hypothetical protein [Cyanobacteria bacterium UBA9273]HBL60117.1 hypothetical protein [Cyanobacteria bacterium UBA8803]